MRTFALLLLLAAPDRMTGDFAWFDTLGLPPLADAPLVRVATGSWSRIADADPVGHHRLGFLLAEDPNGFGILGLDLARDCFIPTPPGTPEHERVGHERLDLARFVGALLDARAAEDADERRDRRWGAAIGEATELFVLARACAAQGEEALARRAYEAARDARGRDARPLRAVVADQIAHAWMWRAVAGFEDPAVPWTRHRARLRRIAEHFPRSEHHDRARDLAALLDRMIAEFEAHPEPPGGAPDRGARVAELVFRLPEQNGRQWSQPGACNPLDDPRGEESPAGALVAIGWEAVPALIGALDDDRLTRCVGYHRDFYFSHRILRVREVAAFALDVITGGELPTALGPAPARAWWAEHGAAGERAFLVEGVRAGGAAAIGKAQRMLARHADALLDPLCAGIERTGDDAARAELVRVLAALDAPAAEAVLRAELDHAPGIRTRVEAAVGLVARGRRAVAIDAMLAAWRAGGPPFDGLVEFLCGCRDPRAIEALAARPLAAALAIDVALDLRDDEASLFSWRGIEQPPAPPEWDEAIERFLLHLLDDTRERRGLTMSGGSLSFSDPRVCDVAAAALAERWPGRYDRDAQATFPARERARARILGRPAPYAFPVTPPGDARVVPLLGPPVDVDALEALGLGALAWLEHHPDRVASSPALREVRRRLATRVAWIEWAEGGAEPDGPLRDAVEALRDRPLDPEALAAILTGFARRPPGGCEGLRLRVAREGDGTGVFLQVLLHAGTVPDGGPPEGWDRRVVIRSPEQALRASTHGSGTHAYAQRPECWRELVAKLTAATHLPPATPFEALAELWPDRNGE